MKKKKIRIRKKDVANGIPVWLHNTFASIEYEYGKIEFYYMGQQVAPKWCYISNIGWQVVNLLSPSGDEILEKDCYEGNYI